jgi:hypothetical protein
VRLGMKHVLVLFCLTLAAVFASPTPYLNPVDVAMRTSNCIPRAEIVVATTDQLEVHAVVVDMPQRASLEYASPESWGTLPTFDPPNEVSPTKPVLQVALN